MRDGADVDLFVCFFSFVILLLIGYVLINDQRWGELKLGFRDVVIRNDIFNYLQDHLFVELKIMGLDGGGDTNAFPTSLWGSEGKFDLLREGCCCPT